MNFDFRGRRGRRRLGSLLTILMLVQAMLLGVAPAALAAAPTVSSVTPSVIGTGYSQPQTITVTGTNFVPGGTTVRVLNGQGGDTGKASNVAVSSATQLTFTLGTGLGVGSYTVRVQTPDGTGDGSLTVADPSISLSPAQVSAGYSDTSVSVTGINTSFVSGTTVVEVLDSQGNNTNKVASGSVNVTSGTSLSFTLLADLAAGTYGVRVTTGSQQATATLTVVTPSVSLDTAAVNVGYAQTPITATGSNTHFSGSSQVVLLDSQGTDTNKVSNVSVASTTSLSFSLLTGLVYGNYTLRITTGGETVSTAFTVRTPSITASPAAATVGYTAFGVTVTGTNTDFSQGLTSLTLTQGQTDYTNKIQNPVINSTTSVGFTLAAGLGAGSYTLTVTTNRTGGAQTASTTLQVFGGRLAFTNAAPNLTVGDSVYLTLELQDAQGAPLSALSDLTVALASTSSGGIFSLTAGGQAVTTTQIVYGTTTASVYYRDTLAGTPTLRASVTGYQPATQQATVSAAAASKLAVTTQPVVITAGTRSGAITVELRDPYDNAVAAGAGGVTVGLTTSSGRGAFYAQASGGSAITSVAIPQGSVSASVYYEDTAAGSPTLTYSATGLTQATQAATVNAAAIAAISPYSPNLGVAAGSRVAVAVTLRDAYGNTGATSAPRTVNLSKTSDTGAFYAQAAGGSPIAAITLPQGTGTFTVYFADTVPGVVYLTLSRSGWTPGSVTVTVGTESTPPTVSVTAPTNNSATNVTTPSFTASASDNAAVSYVVFAISSDNGANWTTVGSAVYSAPYTVTSGALADGTYQVRATAVDTSGNSATDVVTFTVDTAAPTLTVTASPSPVTSPANVTITVTSSEALSGAPTVTVTPPGGSAANVTMTSSGPNTWTGTYAVTSSSPNGTYTVTASGTDAAGNPGSGSGSFTVSLATGGGGGGGGGGVQPQPTEPQASSGEGDAGSAVSVADPAGTYAMELPAGAVETGVGAKVKVDVVPLAAAQVEELLKSAKMPEGVTSIGKAFEFKAEVTADGKTQAVTRFAKPVTFTVNLSADDLKKVADPEKVGVFRLNGDGTLTFVGGKLVNGKLVVQLYGFSRYVLAEVKVAFNDMKDHWAKADVELMGAKYVVKGLPGGGFGPGGAVTRAQFAAMLVRAMGLPTAGTALDFKDVKGGAWYYGELATAVKAGLIQGFGDGTFRPDAPVTREQVAAMVARALRASGKAAALGEAAAARALVAFGDAGSVSAWARDGMALAVHEGIVRGQTAAALAPRAGATRAEAAAMIARFWRK